MASRSLIPLADLRKLEDNRLVENSPLRLYVSPSSA